MNYVGYPPAPPGTIMVGDTNAVGMVGWFHRVPDASWLALNGQQVLKATFPDLWAYAQGMLTADQATNPGLFMDVNATTFALPKFDGLFVRSTGLIDANHAAAAVGVKQADDNKAHTHTEIASGAPGSNAVVRADSTLNAAAAQGFQQTASSGGTEARPVNVALVPCIKATRTALLANTISAASQADVQAGTSGSKFVSPSVQGYAPGMAKAWVNFNGTGTVAIRAAFNVSSITDNGVGSYTANFTTPMPTTNFVAVGSNGRAVTNTSIVNVNGFNIITRNMADTAFDTAENYAAVY